MFKNKILYFLLAFGLLSWSSCSKEEKDDSGGKPVKSAKTKSPKATENPLKKGQNAGLKAKPLVGNKKDNKKNIPVVRTSAQLKNPIQLITNDFTTINGKRALTNTKLVFYDHKKEISTCFAKGLKKNKKLAGRVRVAVAVSGQGKVKGCEVKKNFGVSVVGSCICNKVRTWKFPKPKGGMAQVVHTWTLHHGIKYPYFESSGKFGGIGFRKFPLKDGIPLPRINFKIGPVKVKGDVDQKEVSLVIRAHRPHITKCYQKALLRNSKLQGTVGASFAFGKDNRVKYCKITKHLAKPKVGNCICKTLKTWKFPAPTKKKTAKANVSWQLTPAKK